MAKRNLLLCFDAFGTLFSPKQPIPKQYNDVARSLGHIGFTDDQVQSSFKTAFKAESKKHPNFGKVSGLNASKWWANIIHETFQPLVGAETKLHEELAPRLLHRFSSAEAYDLTPDVSRLLESLRSRPPAPISRVAIGVITNSDDRVPDVLTSLGLRVSPLRHGGDPATVNSDPAEKYDIDFTVMSYDVGHEKPDRQIFEAAEALLLTLPVARGTTKHEWEKVYVGDEFDKDCEGAMNAGWAAVLVGEHPAINHSAEENSENSDPPDELSASLRAGESTSVASFRALARLLGTPRRNTS
ncbi:hypothetical protein LTR62_007678 [Meristemomyces frigidus]|uniref:Haloacid dehalogenase n=1 Tax=Meristemomyces frigidus TaxID=1508187 RepID=A0AAN7TAE7_9PEZI|nr:hypothetical protein LTR62_007678 [Meristemomyces frigidus]